MKGTEEARSGRVMVASSDVEMAVLDLLDHNAVEWGQVRQTAFLVHQHFAYEYPGPIEELNHRLVIVPPEVHLDQERVMYRVDVSAPDARVSVRSDTFGNMILDVYVPRVERTIEFEAWIVVKRSLGRQTAGDGQTLIDALAREPSTYAEPNRALQVAALELRNQGGSPLDLARRINSWVYRRLAYAHDTTDIHTTAAEALALGRGVCQDYAHVMLALCRIFEIPARYVSGHLLGEGGTHAWVEVLLPDPDSDEVRVWPFDPTHNREPGLSYVSVAVGRDYGDVAPTSGTYRASHGGRLSTRKHVGLTAVEYA